MQAAVRCGVSLHDVGARGSPPVASRPDLPVIVWLSAIFPLRPHVGALGRHHLEALFVVSHHEIRDTPYIGSEPISCRYPPQYYHYFL